MRETLRRLPHCFYRFYVTIHLMNPENTPHSHNLPAVLIVHDVLGSPTADWIPTVKKTLESMGHTVFTPALPTEVLASYTLWGKSLTKTLAALPSNSIMIGHGIGGNILLSLLSKTNYAPVILVLINSLSTFPEHMGYRKIANSFLLESNNYEYIKNQVGQIFILQSTNDPFVTYDHGTSLQASLGGTLQSLDIAHGTAADGIVDFPEITAIVSGYDQIIIQEETLQKQSEKALRDTQLVAANTPGLRTMQTDMSQISTKNVSTVGSGLLRQVRIEEKIDYTHSIKNPVNIVYFIITLLLIIGGVIGFGIGVFKFIPETATVFFKEQDVSQYSPMVIDALSPSIEINTKDSNGIFAEINALVTTNASTKHTYIGIPVTQSAVPASLRGYFKPIGIAPSENQLSILDQVPFYGLSLRPSPAPFMIIPIDNYDRAYTAMSSWTSVPRDIGIWMMIDPDTIKQTLRKFSVQERVVANTQIRTVYFPEFIDTEQPTSEVVPEDVDTLPEDALTTPAPKLVEALSWTFLDEHHILIVKNTTDIPEIKKRFHEKQGRLAQ
jgi:predicted alpha/beta hydrolase family esterase